MDASWGPGVNIRLPLVGSVAALIAGIIVAALVLAFCGGSGGEPGEPTASATAKATRTARPTAVTRTPGAGTPSPTGTAEPGEPGEDGVEPPGQSPVPPPAETPPDGIPGETPTAEPPGEATPEPPPLASPPPPGETATAIPGPPPAGKTATRIPATPTPTVTPTPTATATPTPSSELPDLVVRDLRVRRDRIVIVIGNDGEGDLLAGQTLEVGVRGIVAESVVMPVALSKGQSFTFLLEDQLLYKWEKVMGRVDPNDLIREEPRKENNNALSKVLLPDVALDLAVVALLAVGREQHLAVHIRNNTEVPVVGADVRVQVYRGGGKELTAAARPMLNLGPYETVRVDVFDQVAVRGVFFRVVMELVNLPDANTSNDSFAGTVP